MDIWRLHEMPDPMLTSSDTGLLWTVSPPVLAEVAEPFLLLLLSILLLPPLLLAEAVMPPMWRRRARMQSWSNVSLQRNNVSLPL